MMNTNSSFFSELRRRNVFRVALTYAVVAWLLREIASVFLPMLDAPEWIVTAFVVLLALGFALALFVSWSFEMTPEGLKRTEDLAPDEVIPYWSRRKFARFIVGVAVIAFGLSAYQLLLPKRAATFSKHRPGSISTPSTTSSLPEKARNIQSAEQILRDLDADWSKAAAAKNVDQTVAYYSDDAMILPPNTASAVTKESIRKTWQDLLETPGLVIRWKPAQVQLANSGDMSYTSGTYEVIVNGPNAKASNDRGKYVEIWKKQPDGNWKCSVDIWNSDLPVTAPAPAEKK